MILKQISHSLRVQWAGYVIESSGTEGQALLGADSSQSQSTYSRQCGKYSGTWWGGRKALRSVDRAVEDRDDKL